METYQIFALLGAAVIAALYMARRRSRMNKDLG